MPLALISLAFGATVLVVGVAIVAIVAAATRRASRVPAHLPTRVAAAFLGWLALTAIATAIGLVRFDHGPQRVLPLPIVAVAASVLALRSATGRALVAAAPRTAIVALQAFRLPVELVLWALSLRGAIPATLTFEGANFDVIVGLTAAPIAFVAWGGARRGTALAMGWHLASLALLANVVIRAIRAAPDVVASVPFVWLPAFLVPVAVVSHLVGLTHVRAAWSEKREQRQGRAVDMRASPRESTRVERRVLRT